MKAFKAAVVGFLAGGAAGLVVGILAAAALGIFYDWLNPADPSAFTVACFAAIVTGPAGAFIGGVPAAIYYACRAQREKP